MKAKNIHIDTKKAENLQEKKHNQPAGVVNPQEREQLAHNQQEWDHREEEAHSSEAKGTMRQKIRQGLHNR